MPFPLSCGLGARWKDHPWPGSSWNKLTAAAALCSLHQMLKPRSHVPKVPEHTPRTSHTLREQAAQTSPSVGMALTVTDLPHVLAVLDTVDHFQKDFFLLLNSTGRFSQSFNPMYSRKAKRLVQRMLFHGLWPSCSPSWLQHSPKVLHFEFFNFLFFNPFIPSIFLPYRETIQFYCSYKCCSLTVYIFLI